MFNLYLSKFPLDGSLHATVMLVVVAETRFGATSCGGSENSRTQV